MLGFHAFSLNGVFIIAAQGRSPAISPCAQARNTVPLICVSGFHSTHPFLQKVLFSFPSPRFLTEHQEKSLLHYTCSFNKHLLSTNCVPDTKLVLGKQRWRSLLFSRADHPQVLFAYNARLHLVSEPQVGSEHIYSPHIPTYGPKRDCFSNLGMFYMSVFKRFKIKLCQ